MRIHKIAFPLLLSSLSLFSMDAPMWVLPKELIRKEIVLSNDRQTIGRFGRTSHENNQWYREHMICKDPHDNECTSPLCCFLTQSSRIPMEPLSFYAKKYYEDTSQNVGARVMFFHLWRHHDKERRDAIEALRGIKTITDDNFLEIYAGKYGIEEVGDLFGVNTDLAVMMKSAVIESNSLKLKRFLTQKDFIKIETLLLAQELRFDPHWSHSQYECYNDAFFVDNKSDTILDCACALNDIHIINRIVNLFGISSFEGCTIDAIKSMIRNYRIELLEKFIGMHYEKARKERFSLWQYAIEDRSWSRNAPNKGSVSERQLFEKIVTLLFPQEIDAQDEHKQSLLHWAIMENNAAAVRFLIEEGANIAIPDYGGFLPLYNAYENPEITQILIDHGAGVNERNAGGRTAIMSAICHGKYNQKALKAIDMLCAAGADPAAVDDQGKSVLHHYAECHSFCSGDALKMIKIFMYKGVKADQKDNNGKTPLDYAQQNHNHELVHLFKYQLSDQALIKQQNAEPLVEEKVLYASSVSNKMPTAIHLAGEGTEKRTYPISYKKIVAMSGLLLLSVATIYYLLKNIDSMDAGKVFKKLFS